ncbi:TetR/AcrR family transcriptional regulator [Histidinibacterium lentulum]|uniref:TetR/AcrR family transcriptional regulator n=1 Tax=Histidinibacterium lentulum TaxID=2480588 RepID=A0A3N2QWA1_9RHOB|nr:TetR/AcrR family transcriptional regulator [Histidinibacterium lentulum]ROT99430.1 TetR/AcrR family transcriptional regulator [Histidinibacterium lentulum]
MAAEDDKREAIVRSAFGLLMRDGPAALTFERLGAEAGMSRQLVRYYFQDLESLLIALCDHLAGLYRSQLVSGAAEAGIGERLDFFLDFYFGLRDDRPKPKDDQAYDALFAYAAGHKPVRERLASQYGLLGQVVSHEIQVSFPEIPDRDAQELSYLFVCLMYGHWKMVASLGHAEEHGALAREAMIRLIESYRAAASERTSDPLPWAR